MSNQMLSPTEKEKIIEDLIAQFNQQSISLGQFIAGIRTNLAGMDQTRFASICDISRRSLQQIEKDQSNPSWRTINTILSRCGVDLLMGRAGR